MSRSSSIEFSTCTGLQSLESLAQVFPSPLWSDVLPAILQKICTDHSNKNLKNNSHIFNMFCKIYLLVHIHRVIQACVRKLYEVSSSISLSLSPSLAVSLLLSPGRWATVIGVGAWLNPWWLAYLPIAKPWRSELIPGLNTLFLSYI